MEACVDSKDGVLDMDSTVTLPNHPRNGKMPRFGLGTYRADGSSLIKAVMNALQLGFRHIDTAEMYDNADEIKQGIAASGVRRQDIFITSKLHPEDQGNQSTWS